MKEINQNTENLNSEEMNIDNGNKGKKAKKKSGGIAFLVLKIVIAITLILVIFYFGFTCTVREGSSAIITRFGSPRATITEAGLHFKLPWPFESVITYDNREQYYPTRNIEITTSDQKNIAFQSYVVWKIDDPLKYHVATMKDGASININEAIQTSVFDAINIIMGKYNLSDLVSSENKDLKTDEIQNKIFERVKESCHSTYSIDIIDVRILRLSYPDANLPNILTNIAAERQAVIDTILAKAEAEKNRIEYNASEEASVILANGANEAAKIRAEAEKEVADIYAKAQAANIELFKFLKELDTIVNSVNSNSVLVVDSNAYPFSILLDYGKEIDENTSVIDELEYVFANISEEDSKALTEAIYKLLSSEGNQSKDETVSGSETSDQTDSATDATSGEVSGSESESDSITESDTTEAIVEESTSDVNENGGT